MTFFITIILPAFYLLLAAFLLQKSQSFRENGVTPKRIVFFFLAKCVAGMLYSYIALKYIPNRGDIWPFYEDGLSLYKTLLHRPQGFDDQVQEMFSQGGGDVLDSQSGMAKTAFEGIKFLQFFLNLFSFGNLYTNTILFNALATFSFLRCWIFLKNQFNTWIPGAWLFLFPSAFFYTAGIHKEGIMFVLMAFLIPVAVQLAQRITIKQLVMFLIFISLFTFFKFFVAALFWACILLYWLMQYFRKKKAWVLGISIVTGIVLFFLSGYLWPSFGLPQVIVQRQQEFLALEAASAFTTKPLEPSFGSFLSALPSAVYNAMFRPLPGQGGKALYYVYTLEILLFWIFILFMWAKNRFRFSHKLPTLVVALFVFAICNLLIIGYTIPNIGATMRYRSIFLPFVGLFAWYLLNGPVRFNKTAENK